MIISHQALWWVPEGHIPGPKEGGEKPDYLNRNGPSEVSFTFAKPFEKPGKRA